MSSYAPNFVVNINVELSFAFWEHASIHSPPIGIEMSVSKAMVGESCTHVLPE